MTAIRALKEYIIAERNAQILPHHRRMQEKAQECFDELEPDVKEAVEKTRSAIESRKPSQATFKIRSSEQVLMKLSKQMGAAKSQENRESVAFTKARSHLQIDKRICSLFASTFLCSLILTSPLGILLEIKRRRLKKEEQNILQESLKLQSHLHHHAREVGVALMQGKRADMQDAYLHEVISIHCPKNSVIKAELYGIFDGHGEGGDRAAAHCKQELPKHLKAALEKFNPDSLSNEGIFMALKLAFLTLHERYAGTGGSTATVALIIENDLWIASVGDSRAVLSNGGDCVQLSKDQICDDPECAEDVRRRGGIIYKSTNVARVNGDLMMSRSIGDRHLLGILRKDCTSHAPKITSVYLKSNLAESSLIIASDGLWNVASSKQVVEFAYSHRKEPLERVAQRLIIKALNAGSGDNISAMVIRL